MSSPAPSAPAYAAIARNGLWDNNPALVQLLGLCPLLAVTASVVNGLALGLATTLVLIGSNLLVSLSRRWVPDAIRIPLFVLIIATFVTVVEMLMHAFLYDLYKVLGIFVPLIVTNCAIIGRAEAFASRQSAPRALADAVAMGLGFTAGLTVLGALREVSGAGTVFANAHLLLGEWARGLEITLIGDYRGFLVAVLPPGAFFGLGLLVALKNLIDGRRQARAARVAAVEVRASA